MLPFYLYLPLIYTQTDGEVSNDLHIDSIKESFNYKLEKKIFPLIKIKGDTFFTIILLYFIIFKAL